MIKPDILLDVFTNAQIHVKVTIVTCLMDLVYKGVRIPTHLLRIALVKYQLISSKVFISIKNYFMFPNNIKRDSFHHQKKNLINAPRQYSSCVIYNCIYLLQSFLYFGSYWLDNISNDFFYNVQIDNTFLIGNVWTVRVTVRIFHPVTNWPVNVKMDASTIGLEIFVKVFFSLTKW